MDVAALLQKVTLFAGLAPAELALLPTARHRLRAGQVLFRFGEAAGRAYVVAAGRLKIVRESDDDDRREIVLDVAGPGTVVGELALLGEGTETRSASAVAMGAVELVAIDRRDLVWFLRRHPSVALALCRSLAARVRRLDAQLLGATFHGLEQRLAHALLGLLARFARPHGRSVEIDLQLSQRELGEMIGFSRESVNKKLAELTRRGVLEMRRGRVVVHSIAKLRAASGTLSP